MAREYRPLTIPKVQWDSKNLTQTYGQLIAQPLEPGFGITIGNALRRVLLGAIEGSAVTSVIIKGVNNEFTSLPGVIEDILHLVLNIKGIIIRNTTGAPGRMSLKITGEHTVTVADIVADKHLELVNTDHVLAHVARDGNLEIEFFVESGRGYVPAQWPVGTVLQKDGRIFVDAQFAPVTKVSFDVEKTRVGSDIDYDKLILHVHTNGAQAPVDTVHYAISVLRTQLEHFLASPEIPFNEISAPKVVISEDPTVVVEAEQSVEQIIEQTLPVEPVANTQGAVRELVQSPIDALELSPRAHNSLAQAGVTRIIDLVSLAHEDELLKIKNFGRKSLTEVREALESRGLTFGMSFDTPKPKKK